MDCLSHININTAVSILGTNKCIPSARCDKYSHPKATMHIHVVPLGIHYYSCCNIPCTYACGDVVKYMLCVNVLCSCVCVCFKHTVSSVLVPNMFWKWCGKKNWTTMKACVFFFSLSLSFFFFRNMFSFFCSRFCSSENYRSSSKRIYIYIYILSMSVGALPLQYSQL